MDPSSLIFVVIVAIWAAYLLGHWVRRRDQLATVQSIDQFSEAMRVLERRPVVRAAADPARRATLTGRVPPAGPTPAARPTPAAQPNPAERRVPSTQAAQQRLVRPGMSARRRAARRRKAILLLSLLVATPSLWVLALGVHVLPWWPAAVVTAMLGWLLMYLRRAARRIAGRAAGRAARQARSLADRPRHNTSRHGTSRHATDATSRGALPTIPGPSGTLPAVPAPRPTPSVGAGGVTDTGVLPRVDPVHAPQAPHVPQSSLAADASRAASSRTPWVPVPVPPPTYTLKPTAQEVAAPTAPMDVAGTAEGAAADLVSDLTAPSEAPPPPSSSAASSADTGSFDLDEILERRIAAGG